MRQAALGQTQEAKEGTTENDEASVTRLQKIKVNGKFDGATKVALQAYLASNNQKLDIDGIFGAQSIRALQQYIGGIHVDGSWGKQTTKGLQTFLNSKGLSGKIDVDGIFGNESKCALQVYLNSTIPNS